MPFLLQGNVADKPRVASCPATTTQGLRSVGALSTYQIGSLRRSCSNLYPDRERSKQATRGKLPRKRCFLCSVGSRARRYAVSLCLRGRQAAHATTNHCRQATHSKLPCYGNNSLCSVGARFQRCAVSLCRVLSLNAADELPGYIRSSGDSPL